MGDLRETDYLLDVYPRQPFRPVRGEGVHLYTADGRKLIDFYGGHAVALLGYGHPRLTGALADQAATLHFQSNAVELEVRARAARALVDFAPAGLTRAFLVNSGAEANENALRLAFRHTGRERVVALEGGFHGRTAGAGAATHGSDRWYGFPARPFPVDHVPVDDAALLAAAVGPDTAAILLEPVQGIAGARDLAPAFVRAARQVAAAAGALLIFDEVQCGMGRTGHPFAADYYGVAPDILTTAKGLAGGFPAGAVLVTDAIARDVGHGQLGSTFGGGPLAAAMIETVIDVIRADGLLASVRARAARIRETCVVGPVRAIRGVGFLLGLRTEPPARDVVAGLLERGILAGGSADPHVVRLLPPLTLADEHVDALAAALQEMA